MTTYAHIQNGTVIEIIEPITDENGDEIAIELRYTPEFVAALAAVTGTGPAPQQGWTATEASGVWTFAAPRAPAQTLADAQSTLTAAVQTWLDATAQGNGYDNIASCASYINSAVAQWAADAKAAIAWRDAVWQACFAQWSAAQSASNPVIPTAAALVAELPQPAAYSWTVHAAGS